jgi:hypothetical protein
MLLPSRTHAGLTLLLFVAYAADAKANLAQVGAALRTQEIRKHCLVWALMCVVKYQGEFGKAVLEFLLRCGVSFLSLYAAIDVICALQAADADAVKVYFFDALKDFMGAQVSPKYRRLYIELVLNFVLVRTGRLNSDSQGSGGFDPRGPFNSDSQGSGGFDPRNSPNSDSQGSGGFDPRNLPNSDSEGSGVFDRRDSLSTELSRASSYVHSTRFGLRFCGDLWADVDLADNCVAEILDSQLDACIDVAALLAYFHRRARGPPPYANQLLERCTQADVRALLTGLPVPSDRWFGSVAPVLDRTTSSVLAVSASLLAAVRALADDARAGAVPVDARAAFAAAAADADACRQSRENRRHEGRKRWFRL